ncbi:hypothetical protein ABZ023_26505 [Streptomyces sp. NPDC006367]|uniref:hypothetical protein n=1 Tax=unclassified Streptomyces TaxID=2593676 RepID=UPI0033A0F640
MRLFTPASPRPVAAAALLAACAPTTAAVLTPAVPAHAVPAHAVRAPLPSCTAPDDHTFPLTTRVHGGPSAYAPGGGPGVWYLDLTNTTSRTCEAVHPVVVLFDDRHALGPAQVRLEFHDGERLRPVVLEATGRDELIGAFGEGEGVGAFPGFTVGPGRTLTVKVRLAFTPDAAPGEVTANAAVVQRRGDDGEWIGQSGDYRFRVGAGSGPRAGTGATAGESAAAGSSEPVTPSVASTPDGRGTGFPFADELAGTGRGRPSTALAAAALLVAAGATAVLLARGRR